MIAVPCQREDARSPVGAQAPSSETPEHHPEEGRKFDGDKDRWDLLPFSELRDVVRVLTVGARKYAPANWKYVQNPRDRYFSALMRHLTAWREGEESDPETGISHLAHATCCLLFLQWHDKNQWGNNGRSSVV